MASIDNDRNRVFPIPSSSSDFSNNVSAGQPPVIQTALTTRRGRVLKRLLDVTFSLPIVCFMLPPVALIAWVSQRLQSPGPLFFRQERCGINKRKFTILKLRTMNEDSGDGDSDPEARIFPIGDLLRKTKLDEVPQFVNVLAGSMSIVGPRPHHFEDCVNFEKAVEDYSQRTIAKPGITGWAQYKEYRGDFEWNCVENRVQRDLAYIRQWSLFLDLQLIVKTANVIQLKSSRAVFRRLIRRPQPEVNLAVFSGTVNSKEIPAVDVDGDNERKAA